MPEPITISEAFGKQLIEWEKKYRSFAGLAAQSETRLLELGEQLQAPLEEEARYLERISRAIQTSYFTGTSGLIVGAIPKRAEREASAEVARIQGEIASLRSDFLKQIFYTDLYSFTPALVAAGKVTSADEILGMLSVPDDLSEDELESVRQGINKLLRARAGAPPEEELGIEEEAELPELVPPEGGPKFELSSIHRLTREELIKSLTAPRIPQTSMTRDEWAVYLKEREYSEEDIEEEVQMTAEQLVAEAQNRKNMVDTFKSESARMPERDLLDLFKMSVLNPPLVALEALNFYYEHVSMPAAGFVYGQIPDIKRAYFDYIRQNPEASDREAFVYAWKKWEAPGPPVLDFILKYMIMEGLVDPVSLVGWGFVTRGLRALGPAGRLLASANAGAGAVLELPFDFIKHITSKVIPKTIRQTATMYSRNSESVIKVAFEKYHNIPLYEQSPKQLKEAGEFALNHLAKNPRAEDDFALAAKELLNHPPVSKKEASGWAARLRKLGEQTITEDQITNRTLLDLSDIFEKVFTKQTMAVEEASYLLRKLGVMEGSEDAYLLAERILTDRANNIFSHALDFAGADKTRAALVALSKKQSKIYERTAASEALVEATKSGRFALFLHNVESKYVRSWAHYLNRYVIRSAADSYLTFGGYGFGNAGEDMWRSILGGVKPGRATVEDIDTAFIGLVSDPTLRTRGISEMIGELRKVDEGAWHNWILTFSTLWAGLPTYLVTRGKVTPRQVAEKAFQVMVEMPGAFSADVRRNFALGRYSQILADTGGDAYKALSEIAPKSLPPELKSAPKWVRKNLINDIRRNIETGKFTSDNIEIIQRLKSKYTHDKILKAEIDDILKRYPEVSPTVRSMVKSAVDDGTLFASVPRAKVTGITFSEGTSDLFWRAANEMDIDLSDLPIRRVTTSEPMTVPTALGEYEWKAQIIRLREPSHKLNIRTLQHEIAHAIFEREYNKRNTEFFARLAEASGTLDAARFVRAGEMDRSMVSLTTELYANPIATYSIVSRSKAIKAFQDVFGMGTEEANAVYGIFADFFPKGAEVPRVPDSIAGFMRTAYEAEIDDFLRSPERATSDFDSLVEYLTKVEVQSPQDMAELITAIQRMTTTYGMLPDQVMARATVKSRGLPIDDRRLQFESELDRVQAFLEKAGADIDKVVDRARSSVAAGFYAEMPESYGTYLNFLDALESVGLPKSLFSDLSDFVEGYSKLATLGKDFPDSEVNKLYALVTKGKADRYERGYYSASIMDKIKVADASQKRLDKVVAIDSVASEFHDRGSILFQAMEPKEFYEIAEKIPVEKVEPFIEPEALENLDVGWGISTRMAEITESVLDDLFAGKLKKIPIGDAYSGTSQRFLDLATIARQEMSAAKSRDIAFRQSYFADATQRDLRDPSFWEAFYASEMSHWNNVNKKIAVINSQMYQAVNDINVASGLKTPPRPAVIVSGRPLAPADVAKLVGARGDDLSRMLLDTLIPEGDKDYFVEYVAGLVREGYDRGFDRASIGAVYDQIAASIQVDPASSSWFRVRQKQIESMTKDFHDLYNAKLFPKEQKVAVDRFIDDTARGVDDVLFEPAKVTPAAPDVEGKMGFREWQRKYGKNISDELDEKAWRKYYFKKPVALPKAEAGVPKVAARIIKPGFQNYDLLRQSALDESLKWYYKEYTDYSNANMLDAMMTQFYPFWRYESQRWPWLARSFIRRPGTLAAWGRWENNTEHGYVHIPGTSIDINPFRGTVYGPWSTRLMRRDYPEYYDELEGMGGFVGFFDFLSRYGFYPNIIYGAAMAQFGGSGEQTGGILPSIFSTPLNALIAAFPDNKLVNFISERVFPEMFRQYLTARRVDDLGMDGSLLFAKKKAGQALTEEEEATWAEARRSVVLHSALFEQTGNMRMRSDQSYELAEASKQFIQEQWGYTPEQQREIRARGEKLWDLIGGLDPWETAVLQELEFFKYSGSINPVLPSYQQEILNRIELAWTDTKKYSETMNLEILNLQQDFLVGSERGRLGPDDFMVRVRDLYDKRRQYIDEKVKAEPLMLLENRVDYYQKYGQTMPVQSPYNELMNLYFSIELEEMVDPATGERTYNWDKFHANRDMISDAIPLEDKAQWDTYMSRNTAPIMQVWHDVYNTYLKKYYGLWDKALSLYSPEEQQLINEYLFLERTGQQLERQEIIKEMISAKDGNQLISSFRSGVSDERIALRYANPHLDAWLYYWGRVSSFRTPRAEQVYRQLAKDTGRRIE